MDNIYAEELALTWQAPDGNRAAPQQRLPIATAGSTPFLSPGMNQPLSVSQRGIPGSGQHFTYLQTCVVMLPFEPVPCCRVGYCPCV